MRISKFELAMTFFVLAIFGVFAAEMIDIISGKTYLDMLEGMIFRMKGLGPNHFLQWVSVALFALASTLLRYEYSWRMCKNIWSFLGRFYIRDGKILFRRRDKTTI